MDPTQLASLQKIITDFANALAFLTTPEFLILSLISAIITMAIRKVIEFVSQILADKYVKFKEFVNGKIVTSFYRELFLPGLPLVVGGLFAELVTSYPYPQNWKLSGGRISYGIIAGLLSAFVFPRVMYYYKQLQKVPTDNEKPEVKQEPVQEVIPAVPEVIPEEVTKPDLKVETNKQQK